MKMTKLQMAELAAKKITIAGLYNAQIVFLLSNLRVRELEDVLEAQGHNMTHTCPGCGRPITTWYDHSEDCEVK